MTLNRAQLSTSFLKFNLDGKFSFCIDSELATWAIRIWIRLPHIFSAATLIAFIVMFVIWGIASMCCHSPGILVGFHDVHFLAEVTADIISVTIVCT